MERCVFFGKDEDGEPLLLECYSEKKPRPPLWLVARESKKAYAMVHDYLSAVHLWLLGLRGEIIAATNAGYEPLTNGYEVDDEP